MFKRVGFLAVFVFFILPYVSAQTNDFSYVISNSENWRDVYSSIHYANLLGKGSDFLVSTQHGPILLGGISKENNIKVISARRGAYVPNYQTIINSAGYAGVSTRVVDNANLELIEDLPQIRNFIIVGNLYGYNSIAVNPYALATNSWVFLTDRANVAEVDSILSNRPVDKVVIYGYVDREVTQTLQKYNPEIISTGDRFRDNVEIVKKYLQIKPTKQVSLTNGEFIEKGLMSGMDPILFTGKENVPNQIKDYLKTSPFDVGVLVGSDLVGAATNIRRGTGMSVIVKFARGARNPTGAISSVEGLDLFFMPIPIMSLGVHSARYNRANSQLLITYKSESNIPIYFLGTITPSTPEETLSPIGDDEAVFIAPGDFKTMVYPDFQFNGESLEAQIFTLFGETPSSLERILNARLNVDLTNIIDNCVLEVNEVVYKKSRNEFAIRVENKGTNDCWADAEISNLVVNNVKITIGSEGALKIPKGKKKDIVILQELTDEDLSANSIVDLTVYYGEREDLLVKVIKGKFQLKIQSISMTTVLLALGVLLVIILIIFIIRRRKQEDYYF